MESIFSILLLPLLAGYILNNSLPIIGYKIRGQSGHHLIMSMLITGLIFLLPASYYLQKASLPWLTQACALHKEEVTDGYCRIFSFVEGAWKFFAEPITGQLGEKNSPDNPIAGDIVNASLLSVLLAIIIWCISKALDFVANRYFENFSLRVRRLFIGKDAALKNFEKAQAY